MTGKWVLTGGDYEDGMVAWVEDNKSSVRQDALGAAAPELLEALKAMVILTRPWFVEEPQMAYLFEHARAVINSVEKDWK